MISTPLGSMIAKASSIGICLLEFTDHQHKKRPSYNESHQDNVYLIQLEKELTEYFNGTRQVFTVPLDLQGTVFQQSVWTSLQAIPFGQTWSYKKQADYLNNPKAIRAVASANGYNPISIIIPCHRVIGSNGNLTGYAGGLERKKWLVEFEKSAPTH